MGVTTTFLAATKRRSSKLVVIQTGRRFNFVSSFSAIKESVAFLSSDDVHGREIQQKQPTRATCHPLRASNTHETRPTHLRIRRLAVA